MNRKYGIGEKIKPLTKTPRLRTHNECATFYQRDEMNQDFLYVVGFDEEEEQRLGQPCYWCNVIPVIGGDSFAEQDILPYEENEERVPSTKLADAFIAIRDYHWEFIQHRNRKILVPPVTDERRKWTAKWDEDGLPHWLPKFSQGEK